MSSLYRIVNAPDFRAKIEKMFANYEKLPMAYNSESHTSYYPESHRLTELDEIFDGEMFIEVTPAPNHENSMIVAKATLYLVTEDGPEEIMNRFGRASLAQVLDRSGAHMDLVSRASRVATRRLLEAMGMPSNDISKNYAMGEYDLLEQRLESLKITLSTALGEYNNRAKLNNKSEIKKGSIKELTVTELNLLLNSLPNVVNAA